MESPHGQATRSLYEQWFDKHVGGNYIVNGAPWFTGVDCYRLRCSFLHEGSTTHGKSRFARFVFTEPNAQGNSVHLNLVGDSLNLGIPEFTREMADAATAWFGANRSSATFKQNYGKFVRRHTGGLPGFMPGVPVIA